MTLDLDAFQRLCDELDQRHTLHRDLREAAIFRAAIALPKALEEIRRLNLAFEELGMANASLQIDIANKDAEWAAKLAALEAEIAAREKLPDGKSVAAAWGLRRAFEIMTRGSK